jgi:DNA-binding NtrC family response regulator
MDSVRKPDASSLHWVIVEDEPDVADALRRTIALFGPHRVEAFSDAEGALRALDAGLRPDAVCTDLRLPGMDGLGLVQALHLRLPRLPIVVVSAYASIDNAVRATKLGAFDFLAKPFTPDAVEMMLARVAREVAAAAEFERLREAMHAADPALSQLLGESAPMKRLRAWIEQVRDSNANTLIEGETGTGKELVARALHAGRGPFIAVNMAALPAELAEGELFGHKRGAFTGATRDRPGLIAQSHGGTLFLDEINAMPAALQAKLLRVIQEHAVRPVGGTQDQPVQFRLFAASNQDLQPLTEQGAFRLDLLHRLRVLHVRLPPLRERRGDIPLLAQRFVARYASAHGRRVSLIAPDALAALMAAPWPGNVRELENAIEQAVILSDERSRELPLALLPPELGGRAWEADRAAQPGLATLADIERHYILQVLQRAEGNKLRAAHWLDIDYKTLLRKLSRYSGRAAAPGDPSPRAAGQIAPEADPD